MAYTNLIIASPLEQFAVTPLFPITIGETYIFGLTNVACSLLLVAFAVPAAFLGVYRVSRFQPELSRRGRFQTTIEGFYELIAGIVKDTVGARGQQFIPVLVTLFFFIFFSNACGILPKVFTSTSHLIITVSLSVTLFFGINVVAFREHGSDFFGFFLPGDVPLAIAPFLVPIEILSYVFRVVSLAVRLFANIIAGHSLLHILAGFGATIFAIDGIFGYAGLIPWVIVIVITGLEVGIAFLQAYVFTILCCLYINDALYIH